MYSVLLSNLKRDEFSKQLDVGTLHRLAKSEEQAQKLEVKYTIKVEQTMECVMRNTLISLEEGRKPDLKELEKVLSENIYETILKGFYSAFSEEDLEKRRRLSSGGVPKWFEILRKRYDKYRKQGELPPKQKAAYERIKKEYLEKCKTAWDRYGESFRTGNAESRVAAENEIREAAGSAASRAKTIVRTETTSRYNETRKEYFDRSPDVSHYLFLAVRDQRTTCWCTQRTINGKRGRHGLVYAKDDPLCDQECPACHWNCRSTMVPLTRFNPSHLKLIENKSIQRRNVTCFPLPEGWVGGNRRSA